MSESLEITYYGQGFSKGKNGKQKPLTGIVIGKGEPIKAWLSSIATLTDLGYDMESIMIKYLIQFGWQDFKKLL